MVGGTVGGMAGGTVGRTCAIRDKEKDMRDRAGGCDDLSFVADFADDGVLGGWKCSHTPPRNSSWTFFPPAISGFVMFLSPARANRQEETTRQACGLEQAS